VANPLFGINEAALEGCNQRDGPLPYQPHRTTLRRPPDLRRQAETDPRGFFDDHPGSLILDEVQRVPGLFSYLQEKTDLEGGESRYVLTGSQQFLLMAGITQSLAGRIATFKLFPFTVAELKGYPPDKNPDEIFEVKTDRIQAKPIANTAEMIWKGLYPRIYDKHLDAGKWLEEYIQTYVERDVRSLTNVGDLRSFEAFIKACAANSGQLLNLTALSSAVGVSIPTAKRWVSLLETSGLLFLLPPYHRNFRKRLVKTPKLYFIDTGLLCRLLSIRTPEELRSYPLYGSIFETFVVSEMYKRIAHTGEPSSLFFYRDKTGAEVDLIADLGMGKVRPMEIKSTRTYSDDLSESVRKWVAASGKSKVKTRSCSPITAYMEITLPPFFSMILTAFFVRCAETSFSESCVCFPNIINIGMERPPSLGRISWIWFFSMLIPYVRWGINLQKGV